MGTETLPSAQANTVIPKEHHNTLRAALIGDHVPRNTSAAPADESGSIGQSAFRWLQGYIKKIFIGDVADNISFEADGGDCVIKVGGNERVRIPQANGYIPEGSVMAFAGDTDKAGWLICDGREVSRTTYAALFTAIGTTHGEGNGSSTFNIPDYRGRFLRGVDSAAGRDPDAATRTAMATGANTGDNVGSVQGDAVKDHTHKTYWGGIGAGNKYAEDPYISDQLAGTGGNTTGVDEAYNTESRPINANVNYIIKY